MFRLRIAQQSPLALLPHAPKVDFAVREIALWKYIRPALIEIPALPVRKG